MKTHASTEAQTTRRPAAAHAAAAAGGTRDAATPRDTAQRLRIQAAFGATAQKAADEELLQGRFAAVQRTEEEEPLHGRFDTAQRAEEEEPLQAKAGAGGLPAELAAGVEQLSGVSMAGVRVHRNSSKPGQLQALAYAQGQDIHLAPGQEQHLPHEAWHVAQQAQGRVRPTLQAAGGVAVNDDPALEAEADAMGAKALQMAGALAAEEPPLQPVAQRRPIQFQAAETVQLVRKALSVYEIAFTQASVGPTFTDVPKGVEPRMKNLMSSQDAIDKSGELPEWIQGLRVFSIKNPNDQNEQIFSIDNRRLMVLKQSKVGNTQEIPVTWASFAEVIEGCFKFTNASQWEMARITSEPTKEERAIAPTGTLLGDFFAALLQAGFINAQGQLTGQGQGDVAGTWSFNQAA